MQRFLIAVLAAVPLPALAQGFVRAAGEFQYQKHDDADFDVDSVQGYLDTASMLGTFGAQVGVTPGKEIGRSPDIDVRQYNAVAVHAITDPSDILRRGATVLADNEADGIALYAAEALFITARCADQGTDR